MGEALVEGETEMLPRAERVGEAGTLTDGEGTCVTLGLATVEGDATELAP